jgi:1,4-dihydroxy-2-naphthoate octaprenyltransferase
MSAVTPTDTISRKTLLKGWVQLSRPPFHLVGVLPFILGAVAAWQLYGVFHWPIFLLSVLAVVFIMLATYYAGEYYDFRVDQLSAQMERNIFSGGTQILQQGLLPREHARIASYVALALAGAVGLILQFGFRTGPWTIPLGLVGMIAGFYYSTPPFRWVQRGIGELLIGFCYGWLPVATSFYLQVGRIDPLVHYLSLPIAFTIFNVILINEFPDYPADRMEGKRNLVVRLGRERAAYLYVAAAVAAVLSGLVAARMLPRPALLLYLPIAAVTLLVAGMMLRKDYRDREKLERMCALTLVTNLGTALAYTLAIYLGK